MFVNTLDPVFLSVGYLHIRWYGVMYVLAFLFTYWYVRKQIRQNRVALTEMQLDTLLFWMIVSMLIGARLVEVLYYNPGYYFAFPLKAFALWEGGLSFHGGLLGIVVATVILSRRMKLSFWQIADVFAVPAALGQALGRIGNFFNHELYGHVTSSFFGVNFNTERDATGSLVFRHPSQLYEAGYDLVIFGILLWRSRRLHVLNKDSGGTQFALFLVLYGTFRFVTEFFRVTNFYLGPLTAGQVLNLPVILAGIGLFVYFRMRAVRAAD